MRRGDFKMSASRSAVRDSNLPFPLSFCLARGILGIERELLASQQLWRSTTRLRESEARRQQCGSGGREEAGSLKKRRVEDEQMKVTPPSTCPVCVWNRCRESL
ncbi:uncharacterized protein LOC112342660 [Selaginella moellendorffii]|uniref:uncharacterized protein LOC112342660 n=1 Tax=Selaginella moellendorffii TaxID=88036 RepID=UPI000D1C5923|nr:uncharacterized protein LOC112342660 [Selaginella moellendorffii]|eukprot:XP_024520556.1 uncharacterized protein LOC112342660 [Selaginella moellendorffii]